MKKQHYFVVKEILWDGPSTKTKANRILRLRKKENKDPDEDFKVKKATSKILSRYGWIE